MHRRALLLAFLVSLAAPMAAPAVAQDSSGRTTRVEIVVGFSPNVGFFPASGEVLAVDLGGQPYTGILVVRDILNGYANSWRLSYVDRGAGLFGYFLLYQGSDPRTGSDDFVYLWYDRAGTLYLIQAGDRYWLVN